MTGSITVVRNLDLGVVGSMRSRLGLGLRSPKVKLLQMYASGKQSG